MPKTSKTKKGTGRKPRERDASEQEQAARTDTGARAIVAVGAGGRREIDDTDREELRAMRDRINNLLGETEAAAPTVNKLLPVQTDPEKGNITVVFGADPHNRYALRYEVRELDDLITSNTPGGAINPAYPAELQPRDRTRAASQAQIQTMARSLEPDALTTEFNALDRGAPIIGDDNIVESGNGRTMALKLAADAYPEQYGAYVENVKAAAREKGIDPAAVEKMKRPVLVRVRVDNVDRAAFAAEANTAAIMSMSETERARQDAGRISAADLIAFESTGTLEADLKRTANRPFVRSFVADLPETDRASVMDRTGELTQAGARRIAAAMFTRVYNDAALSDRIFESQDNDIKNITSGLMQSLGPLAKSEELARTGQRESGLSIAGDIAAATRKLASIKERGDMTPEMYLAQGALFGDDLTPAQRQIFTALNERRRSAKAVREFVEGWSNLVEREPHPSQIGLFGPSQSASKEQLVSRWLAGEGETKQATLF